MSVAPLPPDETERLADLKEYEILDTPDEESFDAIAWLAAHICGTPMSFINLLDERRQWFKARVGIGLRQTPREFAFCGYTILHPEDALVVPDAQRDERFADNPLVVREPNIRFYVGVPLVSSAGHALGTLSVLDHAPRENLDPEQVKALRILAAQVSSLLELRRTNRRLREAGRERARLAEARATTLRELQNVLETVPDIIYVLDPEMRLVRWNRQAEKVTGYTGEELRARPVATLFPPEEHEHLFGAIQEAFATGYAELESRLLRKDGATKPYWFTGRPLHDARGELIGLTGAGRDVGRQKEAEAALREQRDRLEKLTKELRAANHELESFAFTVSHDLRAPLRGVRFLGADLLDDVADALDPQARRSLDRLNAEAARMDQLVEDLLSLSRSTHGLLRRERVDLSRMAREVIADLRAREPDRVVATSVEEGIVAEGDGHLLRIVLENLLSNAWKYTSKKLRSSIEVTRSAPREPGHTAVCVRDDGAGFDPALAGSLFKPFQRLHGKSFPGSGIGLATVQRIVARHGGDVWATSEPGKGATFCFEVPAPSTRA